VLLRLAAAAAAVVVLAAGGYGLVRALAPGTHGVSASSNSAARPARPSTAIRHGTGPPVLGPAISGQVSLPLAASGTDYQPGTLAEQASAVLAGYARHPAAVRPAAGASAAAPFGGKLRACVTAVSGGHRPRLVDLASYRGQRAAVIMVPAAGGRTAVSVAGAGCAVLARATLAAGG
jgi:hypothetical protein